MPKNINEQQLNTLVGIDLTEHPRINNEKCRKELNQAVNKVVQGLMLSKTELKSEDINIQVTEEMLRNVVTKAVNEFIGQNNTSTK